VYHIYEAGRPTNFKIGTPMEHVISCHVLSRSRAALFIQQIKVLMKLLFVPSQRLRWNKASINFLIIVSRTHSL